jgi:Holliday junction resolvase RusA-like endonuclease
MEKKVILNISPQTHIRTNTGDRIFFRIPRHLLRPAGLKRLLRIERYNNYKVDLLAESKRKQFTLSPSGMDITFYIPVPKSWSQKKKTAHHGMLHQSTPDIDNFCKAMFDSLVSEDKFIANISLTKRWVDYPTGWIEIITQSIDSQVLIVPPAKG